MRDPGVGLVTVTRVKVTPDLQLARVFYTQLGDEKARKEDARPGRATPFLRRQIGLHPAPPRLELRFESTRVSSIRSGSSASSRPR